MSMTLIQEIYAELKRFSVCEKKAMTNGGRRTIIYTDTDGGTLGYERKERNI